MSLVFEGLKRVQKNFGDSKGFWSPPLPHERKPSRLLIPKQLFGARKVFFFLCNIASVLKAETGGKNFLGGNKFNSLRALAGKPHSPCPLDVKWPGKPGEHLKGSHPETKKNNPQEPLKKLFGARKVFSFLSVWLGSPAHAHKELNLLPPKKFLSTRFSLQNACKIT